MHIVLLKCPHQLWQSRFSRVYSNCCCSCSFEAEIIKLGRSSHKMYSNNILNFQESMTILNACTKKVWKLIEGTTYFFIYLWQRKEAEGTLQKQLPTPTMPIIAIMANAPAQAETLIHSLERAATSIGLHVNAHKMEYMCFNQTGDISTRNGSCLKLVDKFTYLGSSVSSTETDIDMWLTKAWTAINRLSVIWKSDLTDKMKRSFFPAVIVSILLYGCTTWTLTKQLEKRLDGNHTNAVSNIEQVLEAAPYKVAGVGPPTTHHENYQNLTNQTCRSLLEK